LVVANDALRGVGWARREGVLSRKDDRATENDPETHDGEKKGFIDCFLEIRGFGQL
jgi:hypothetical protein